MIKTKWYFLPFIIFLKYNFWEKLISTKKISEVELEGNIEEIKFYQELVPLCKDCLHEMANIGWKSKNKILELSHLRTNIIDPIIRLTIF